MSKKQTNPNVKRFDEVATSWDEVPRRVELARAVAATLAQAIPLNKAMAAMEFGCGTGLVAEVLAPQLGSITAVDSSQQMLAVLQQKIQQKQLDNIKPLQLDLTREQLPAQHFHLIYSSMTLHHVQDIASVLQQFYQVLLPGGFLAVADLEKEDGSFHDDATGVSHHGFDRNDLQQVLEKIGYEQVRFVVAHRIRKEDDHGSEREYPVFLMVARKQGN